VLSSLQSERNFRTVDTLAHSYKGRLAIIPQARQLLEAFGFAELKTGT
jgi:hypothetical protein